MNFFQYLHRFYGKNTIIGALFFEEKFRSERNLCVVAENALILAKHPLLWNFSFLKKSHNMVFLDIKKEPQFCIKITVLIWRRWWDLNPRARLRTTRFPIVLVMTTSIHLQKRLYYYTTKIRKSQYPESIFFKLYWIYFFKIIMLA